MQLHICDLKHNLEVIDRKLIDTGMPNQLGHQIHRIDSRVASLRLQIQAESRKRQASNVEAVYRKFVREGAPGVSKDIFFNAYREIRYDFSERNEIEKLFDTMDIDNDGYLKPEEFKRAVTCQSEIEQYFSQVVPIAEMFWASLPRAGTEPSLKSLIDIPPDELSIICQAVAGEMESFLLETLSNLRKNLETSSATVQGMGASPKFSDMLNAGSIADYHKGLSERIGMASLDFDQGMKSEHCSRYGWDHLFTTSNYNITTSPNFEWSIATRGREMHSDVAVNGRVLCNLKELLAKPVARKASLVECEVIALVLYTGPMFMVYNSILRGAGEIFDFFSEGHNLFSTTIHVLQSAVVKISRSSKVADNLMLYRGISRQVPASFHKADENGCKGYAEWGFLSTTENRDIAVSYSGADRGIPTATVLQIKTSSVNRPAGIGEFSQYPHEREYLWAPLCFLQPEGAPYIEGVDGGILTRVTVVVSSNGLAETIEDMLSRKQRLHIGAFESMAFELEHRMTGVVWAHRRRDEEGDVIASVMQDVRDTIRRHRSLAPEDYIDEERFHKLTDEMVATCVFGSCKLDLWRQDDKINVKSLLDFPIRTCRRLMVDLHLQRLGSLQDAAERAREALHICRLKRLVYSAVDEVNEVGETRLVEAAAEGVSVASLRLLVEAKSPINAATLKGFTAVCRAAQFGHENCLRFLLEQGASPHPGGVASSPPRTGLAIPLTQASLGGHVACADLLLKARADPSCENEAGNTALISAADTDHAGCVELLLAAQAEVNHANLRGVTPLFAAARNGYVEAVRVLLRAGADCGVVVGTQSVVDVAKGSECRKLLEEAGLGAR